jgi:hypothetical protein
VDREFAALLQGHGDGGGDAGLEDGGGNEAAGEGAAGGDVAQLMAKAASESAALRSRRARTVLMAPEDVPRQVGGLVSVGCGSFGEGVAMGRAGCYC